MANVTAHSVRLATPADADTLADLLHAFNSEFDTPTPGAAVLAPRLRVLLDGPSTFAVITSDAPIGFALVTLRPNVWFEGPVALLDELYVEPSRRSGGIGTVLMAEVERQCRLRGTTYVEINVDAGDTDTRRFYERIGYSGVDPDSGEPAFYYSRELE